MAETIYYDKLVRDKIPEIIEANGSTPVYKILTNREALLYANDKLKEEYDEYIKEFSKPYCPYEDDRKAVKEELADMLEVFYRAVKLNGFTIDEINNIREEKNNKRGAFDGNILLERVIK